MIDKTKLTKWQIKGIRLKRLKNNSLHFKKNKHVTIRDRTGKIIPVIKKCKCGKRIKFHHLFCESCWRQRQCVQNQK